MSQPEQTVAAAPPPLDKPVLSGNLVRLRPHTEADADAIVERCVDPETVRFTTVPLGYTREMVESYLAAIIPPSDDLASWAIEVDGRYAGTIDLRRDDVDDGGGNLGYVTHPAFRGIGVMTEAVRLVVAHAFDDLGWQLVQWKAVVGNYASVKTVWRNGFPLPVHAPALLFERGVPKDGWIATLGAGDPREPVAPWQEVRAVLAAHVAAARWL